MTNIFTIIDRFLDKITMYKLVLYILYIWLALAFVLSVFGVLSFPPFGLVYSTSILLAVSYISNTIFAKIYKTHTNAESAYITALILACIITPPNYSAFISSLPFLILVAIIAMASKYVVAINRKHIFNPAAFAIIITAVTIGHSATWWIGTTYMFPAVLIGGLLITRKIRHFDMVLAFIFTALISIFVSTGIYDNITSTITSLFTGTAIVFFATIMLTEPLTTPPNRATRIIYGIIVGILFAPGIHIGSVYSNPQLALIVGNIASWIMSPKRRLLLTLIEKKQLATNTYEFIFKTDHRLKFISGQYLEWTLAHKNADFRGNRRYFTISSSPTDENIRLGVKFDPIRSSSFKNELLNMALGRTLLAGQLAGDFVMPKDPGRKLCFIAGGIGITPFASMLRELINSKENRDIKILYSVKSEPEIAYNELFEQANRELAIKTVISLTDFSNIPANWNGERGIITADMIRKTVPDFDSRLFYVSGPHSLVVAIKKTLLSLNIPRKNIITDYFPGFV